MKSFEAFCTLFGILFGFLLLIVGVVASVILFWKVIFYLTAL